MSVRIILTDIEGTTSSISFVKNVLFPYARAAMPDFILQHGNEPPVRHWLDRISEELGGGLNDLQLTDVLIQWIDEDRKHTALKALQGMLWKHGYASADYAAHIYPDAAVALKAWQSQGKTIYVYSSGSVPAQKLFFAHTEAGDLTPVFSGYFDTEIGGKREADSYRRIVEAIDARPDEVCFLSDIVEECDAAREAGLQTVLIDRPDDYPNPRLTLEQNHQHARFTRFDEINL
jgi:enolase-phosphatase E1